MLSPCKNAVNATGALPGPVQNLTLSTRVWFVVGNMLPPPLSGWMAGRYGLRAAGDGRSGDGEDSAPHAGGHGDRREL